MNNRFSPEEDDKLIELVRNHPQLYVTTRKTYKNQQIRNNIWKNIAKELRRTDVECKIRWKSMRDYYLRRTKSSRKSIELKNGALSSRFANLRFLDAPIVKTENREDASRIVIEDEELYDPNNGQEEMSEDPLENDSERSMDSYLHQADEDFNQILQKVDAGCSNIERAGQFVSSSRSFEDSAIALFFQSIVATVSEFPRQLQAEAKMKIMQIVTQLELKAAELQSTNS